MQGSQALIDVRHPFLHLALLSEGPAVQARIDCLQERKSLFRGEAKSGCGALLSCLYRLAILMKHRRMTEGNTQVKRVVDLLCQPHRLVAPRPSLGWIPQQPRRPSGAATATHARVLQIEERRRAVLPGIVEYYPLSKVRMRSNRVSQPQECRAHRTVCR